MSATRFHNPIFAALDTPALPRALAISKAVAGASKAIATLGASIFNVHCSGGEAMMRAAVDAGKSVDPNVKIIGVTVLTSMDDSDLEAVGQKKPARDQVLRLAELAKKSGLDGVVCSAHEIEALRAALGEDFLLLV